jgi:histidine ammonia-lyase
MQEDHVSMGWHAARKLRTSVENLRRVLAIELLTAARAIDLRSPLAPSAASAAAIAVLRRTVEGPGPDRFLAPDIAEAEARLADGTLLAAVQEVIGHLR